MGRSGKFSINGKTLMFLSVHVIQGSQAVAAHGGRQTSSVAQAGQAF